MQAQAVTSLTTLIIYEYILSEYISNLHCFPSGLFKQTSFLACEYHSTEYFVIRAYFWKYGWKALFCCFTCALWLHNSAFKFFSLSFLLLKSKSKQKIKIYLALTTEPVIQPRLPELLK